MSKTVTIALANGAQARIDSIDDKITYQLLDANGHPTGDIHLLAQSASFPNTGDSTAVQGDTFVAIPLSNGGFQVVFNVHETVSFDTDTTLLTGIQVDAGGHATTNIGIELEPGDTGPSHRQFPAPELHDLGGGRLAVAYSGFDELNQGPKNYLALVGPTGHSTTEIASQPDAITHANGDVTLTWHENGQTLREVLGEDGSVLAARGVSHDVAVGVADGSTLVGFDVAHDQLTVHNADGSIAGGTRSTLTFDAAHHVLTWDPDSEGPAPTTTVAVLPDVDNLTVANLTDAFRPEVLKVIAADGSSRVEWFDSDHSQTWDTLFATFNAAGETLTYTPVADDGTKTVWTFDPDNTEVYTRYVDQDDAAGHLLERSVLYDDGTSWTAKFTNDAQGHVLHYELDTFDASGHHIRHSLLNPDGTPFH